jgi:hypothetical protein
VSEGIVGSFGTFPYTLPFGKAASLVIPRIKGWITYHNFLERENLEALPEGQWLIGLRPLAAGKLVAWVTALDDQEFEKLFPGAENRMDALLGASLAFCRKDPRVLTSVLSINNREQAGKLVKALLEPGPATKEINQLAVHLEPLTIN